MLEKDKQKTEQLAQELVDAKAKTEEKGLRMEFKDDSKNKPQNVHT